MIYLISRKEAVHCQEDLIIIKEYVEIEDDTVEHGIENVIIKEEVTDDIFIKEESDLGNDHGNNQGTTFISSG